MANIYLKDEAYARLKAAKKEGQSFSDVIMDEIPQKVDLDAFFGSCKGTDAKRILKELQDERRRS